MTKTHVSSYLECLDCDDDNKFDDKYIGETANTGYTRGEEHLNDLRHGRDRELTDI